MSDLSLLLESPPRDWTPASFSDVCARVQDAALPSADGERLYLGLEHLASGLPALVGRGTESDVRSGKTSFRSGDVLFGKLRPYLRKSVLVGEDGICSTDILVFRATEKCIPEFICLLSHTDEFVGHAKATTSGVQHPRTSWSGLREFKLHVPPVPEQRKIAGVLGLVQRAMEQQERLLALTAELKKTLLHQLFTAGLRHEPQKQTDIGEMPKSWNPTPLGICCDIVSGSMSYTDFLMAAESNDEDAVDCMAVKVSDMNLPGNEARFVIANAVKRLPAAIAARKLLPANTVVFPKRGAAIATNKKRMTTAWTVLDPNLIGLRPTERIDSQFLFHWSMTFDLRKITDPGPTPQLNKKDLIPVLMPLPADVEEQRAIAAALDTVDSKTTLHRRKHATLTALFRTLLHQLMTAQIRVHGLSLDGL